MLLRMKAESGAAVSGSRESPHLQSPGGVLGGVADLQHTKDKHRKRRHSRAFRHNRALLSWNILERVRESYEQEGQRKTRGRKEWKLESFRK